MPELPEVETTRRGIEPHLRGRTIRALSVRERRLRQPVPASLETLTGARITAVERRAKYLLLRLADPRGSIVIHLGMSGSLRLARPGQPWRPHDHIALALSSGRELRYHDPRRFGIFLHLPHPADPLDHQLLETLGPEPLCDRFTVDWLARRCRGRRAAKKQVLMNSRVVVGVGNIYANEALFLAGVRPGTAARRLSRPALERLHRALREVLTEAIRRGGTTLRDFLGADGQPGYFRQRLMVYERRGEACRRCGTPIRHRVLGQRSTYWCPACQK
jgi:formamidopyrimidine-DNA glycosylase